MLKNGGINNIAFKLRLKDKDFKWEEDERKKARRTQSKHACTHTRHDTAQELAGMGDLRLDRSWSWIVEIYPGHLEDLGKREKSSKNAPKGVTWSDLECERMMMTAMWTPDWPLRLEVGRLLTSR